MQAFFLLLFLLTSIAAYGDEQLSGSKNFCLDAETVRKNEELARKNPQDEALVKLVAMRIGLCELIAKKIISLDFAIDLFDSERAGSIQQRIQEEQMNGIEQGS